MLCTDGSCSSESGALTAPAVHCVKLLVRERVLVNRLTVRYCLIRGLLHVWNKQLL